MLAFIAENTATILAGLVVLAILAAVTIKLLRDHKNKKHSCGCCAQCPSAGSCHGK